MKKKKKSSEKTPRQKITTESAPQNASPVCYAKSPELRDEYKEK